jgi:hypothetical protein
LSYLHKQQKNNFTGPGERKGCHNEQAGDYIEGPLVEDGVPADKRLVVVLKPQYIDHQGCSQTQNRGKKTPVQFFRSGVLNNKNNQHGKDHEVTDPLHQQGTFRVLLEPIRQPGRF